MKKFKYLFVTLLALVCFAVLAFGGVNDRFSGIDLKEDNYIEGPEITTAPGTPGTNTWRMYVIADVPYFISDGQAQISMIASGATAWSDIGNPTADKTISFDDNEITILTFADTNEDMFTIQGLGAFGDVSVMRVEQKTGNPTDGTVFEVVAADANVDPLVVSASGKANAFVVGQNTGVVTIAGVAEGTDTLILTAGDLKLTDGDIDISGGDIIAGEDLEITGDIIGGTGLINYTNFDVNAAGGVFATSGDFGDGNISNVGNINLDSIQADSSSIAINSTAGNDTAIGNSTGNFTITSDNADVTLTDTTDNVWQLISSGGPVLMDIDLGADDTITVGSGAEKFVLATSNIDISNAGAISGATGVSTSGALASTGTFDVDGNANISDTTAGANITMGNSTGNITAAGDNVDFTLTNATDNVFQLVSSGGPVLMDVDLGADDTITIGSGAEKFVLASSNIDISNAGAITGATGISTSGALASTGTFDVDGTANISDTTAGANTTIGNTTGTVFVASDNIDFSCTDGTDDVFQIVNSVGGVYLDVDLGAADGMRVGNAAGTFSIDSSDWTIGTTGNVTGLGTIGSNGLYTFTGGAAADDAFKVDVANAATGQYFKIDAGPWLGVLGEGAALDFRTDNAATAEAGHAIYIKFQGTAADAAAIDGKGLYIEDESAATAGSYLVKLDSDDNGAIHVVDGEVLLENSAPLKFEGATADAYEAEIDTEDPTTDNTILLPDYSGGLPLVIAQSATQTDCTGVGTDSDITGSSLTIADGWFAATKTLKWTIAGTSDGSGGQAMSLSIDIDGSKIVTLSLDTGQSDDWTAEFTMHEHTAYATQKVFGTLVNATNAAEKFDYNTDTTNFNDGGSTVVKLVGTTNHANDHIYVEYVKVETWTK